MDRDTTRMDEEINRGAAVVGGLTLLIGGGAIFILSLAHLLGFFTAKGYLAPILNSPAGSLVALLSGLAALAGVFALLPTRKKIS